MTIISHHGYFGSGHYVSQGRDEKSGDTFLCDDLSITKKGAFTSANAYLLVYKKV